jgi:hypothetical protein
MDKIVLIYANGATVTLNKNHIAFFTQTGDIYNIVMSSGDRFTGTISGSL